MRKTYTIQVEEKLYKAVENVAEKFELDHTEAIEAAFEMFLDSFEGGRYADRGKNKGKPNGH
jgi:hypothetical protein